MGRTHHLINYLDFVLLLAFKNFAYTFGFSIINIRNSKKSPVNYSYEGSDCA